MSNLISQRKIEERVVLTTHLPLFCEHNLSLSEKGTSGNMLVAIFLGFEELLGFREADSDESNTNGDTGSSPENSLEYVISMKFNPEASGATHLPRLDTSTDTQVRTSSQNIAKSVSLLQYTRHKTSCIHRAMLKSHCNRITINTSHEQSEQTPHSQKLLEGRAVNGADLQQTKNNHVDNHRPFSAELVSCQTEACCAH